MGYPEETKKDLEEIYRKVSAMKLSPAAHGEVNKLIVSTFQVGIDRALSADPLAGYSNLTAAISAGNPIDWERLDGLKVQCVNPDIGMLHGTLERHGSQVVTSPFGWWWRPGSDYVYTITFISAWYGEGGWTLWVEGEIPLRRKTADQLELGTYFLGKAWGDSPCLAYVGRPLKNDAVKTIYYAPDMLKTITPATEWVVLEEYGPFQKPEDK